MSGYEFEDLPLTAFGDLRIAELSPQFQGSFEYSVTNTELVTTTVVNGGTVTQSDAMAVCSTSTTTASSALLQSRQQARYRSGLGGVARFTTLFTTGVASTEQYAGIMDETGSTAAFVNGIAVGYDGATFGLHRFSDDAKTSVSQSSWDDPLDGTGESGITLNHTKLNVWFIQFQFLGAGAIHLWIEDEATGKPVIVHTIDYVNQNIVPSSYNPNYRLTFWVNNKATTNDLITKTASWAYFIEGKTQFIELHQPQFSSGEVQQTSVTTEVAILTIRNKSTYQSKTNYVDIVLQNLSGSIEALASNNLGKIRLVKNATLGGTPSYSDINTTDSVVDYDTAGTTVTGGKELINTPLAGKNDKELVDLTNYKFIIQPGETVTIAGSSAGSASINGSILWKELF